MYIMQSTTILKGHLISLFAKPSEAVKGVVRNDSLRGLVSLRGNACAYLGGWRLHDTMSICLNGASKAYARDFLVLGIKSFSLYA